MVIDSEKYFNNYMIKCPVDFPKIMRGIEILKQIMNETKEAYIIGASVRNLVLCLPIDTIEIYTTASFDELKTIYPKVKQEGNFSFFDEDKIRFIFYDLVDEGSTIDFYDQRIASAVEKRIFTHDALVLTPSMAINDLVESLVDIEEKSIKTIDKPDHIFKNNPTYMLTAYENYAELDFDFNKKLKQALKSCARGLASLNKEQMLNFIIKLLQGKNYQRVLSFFSDNEIFYKINDYDDYFEKIIKNPKLTYEQKVMLAYMLIGKDLNKEYFTSEQYTDFIDRTSVINMLLKCRIKPIDVYHFGEKTLLESDEVAKLYSRKYHSQKHRIMRFNKHLTINSLKDLNISRIEVITLLKGERSLKVDIIMDIMLEKIINGELNNNNNALKRNVTSINNQIKGYFENETAVNELSDSDDYLNSLYQKFESDLDFLVGKRLNEIRNYFALSKAERDAFRNGYIQEVECCLLQNEKYQVLKERGLI